MPAIVLLSSSTASLIAKSLSDKGLTWSTFNKSAGITHGLPPSVSSMYLRSISSLPSALANSSVIASTDMIIYGLHFSDIKLFFVLVDCFKFYAMYFRNTLLLVHIYGSS